MVEELPDAVLYGDSVIIADLGGCQDILYFKDDAKHLLYEFCKQGRLEQDDDEKARVTKLAADLIRSYIKDLTNQTDTFFSFDNLNSSTMISLVPETLQFFIRSLCSHRSKPKDVKIAAFGQSLIKLARPTTKLCPLPLLRRITKVVVLNLWYNYCTVWALAPALKRYAKLKNLCAFMIPHQALWISMNDWAFFSIQLIM